MVVTSGNLSVILQIINGDPQSKTLNDNWALRELIRIVLGWHTHRSFIEHVHFSYCDGPCSIHS